MIIPEEHRRFLSDDFYGLCADLSCFTEDEKRLLIRWGAWLEALADGKIQPFTPAQEKFVRVTRGEESDAEKFEIAWMKLVQQRADEKKSGFFPKNATFGISD